MEFLQALADWPVARALRGSSGLYVLANGSHILGIALTVGAIAALDLRLLGVAARQPLAALAPLLGAVAAAGVALAVLTGGLLFSVRPAAYAANPAFLAKVALVMLGVVNALALRAGRDWRVALEHGAVTGRVKAQAAASLAIWIAAIFAGRWIGFVQ